MKKTIFILLAVLAYSCGVHQKSNIKSNEEFVVNLKRADTRGGMIETVLQGVFFGASYLAEKTSKSLTNTYSQSLSINNYYNTDLGEVEKTYKEIEIKKYSKPNDVTEKERITTLVKEDFNSMPKSRGAAQSLKLDDVIRLEEDDLLNFYAKIELISDPENPSITRLSFNELRIFFSKTKVYTDENLNAKISISIEGQWRGDDGTPKSATLIEQEYDFKNLKYGADNLIKQPILSPWYYDIPFTTQIDGNENYGIVKVNVRLDEYEGNKSKYINQLPTMLSDNKDAIISDGASAIEKIAN
ncbi:hypothetical protein [Winogradskyella sp. SYSU M77433]|uniref:hypothetical protein n=1 Tax=Winogradskyella sp. SYSU M77433 TaxID=3042722 RepID=UPI00248031F8|nr:hypothetical protein [Winogradskyella sp. SYSU M77433]MDH7911262.1 hypothetical protein [Winogradskyella sp. SYSU M77433]